MVYLILIITFLTAQTLTITSFPSGPTYVKLGKNLTLDVIYNYTGSDGVSVDWSKGGNILVRKTANGEITSTNNRCFFKGEASLVVTNTEPNDKEHLKSYYQLQMFFVFRRQEVSSLLLQVRFFCALMHACNGFK